MIAAWEIIRSETDHGIKLVVVGSLGWEFEPVMQEMRTWMDQGEIFVLSNVPANDLRALYRHAAATVCPSLAEGFGFSGIESMRSGGMVIASDIPVHREIYADAAENFDAYSTAGLVNAIRSLLYDENAPQLQQKMRTNGKMVCERYLPENFLPKWIDFLRGVKHQYG